MEKRALIMGLGWDIVPPVAAYYACRALGADAWLALAAGGVAALLRVGVVVVTRRRLDGLAACLAGAFALLLAASAITGDPRVLLARESVLSGAAGLILLGSCMLGRPLMYALARRLDPTLHDPAGFTTISLVWGAGLLIEAAVRVPLIYLLPIDVMAGISPLLQLGTVALLIGWTLRHRRRQVQHAR